MSGVGESVTEISPSILDRVVGQIAKEVAKELGLLVSSAAPAEGEKLATTDQTAAALRLNPETLRRWVRTCPDFPVVKIVKSAAQKRPTLRYRVAEVEAWLKSH